MMKVIDTGRVVYLMKRTADFRQRLHLNRLYGNMIQSVSVIVSLRTAVIAPFVSSLDSPSHKQGDFAVG